MRIGFEPRYHPWADVDGQYKRTALSQRKAELASPAAEIDDPRTRPGVSSGQYRRRHLLKPGRSMVIPRVDPARPDPPLVPDCALGDNPAEGVIGIPSMGRFTVSLPGVLHLVTLAT
ncbi:MAG TPA: hypothetical protein VF506_01730 [Streptosporangiaceae bacterium]